MRQGCFEIQLIDQNESILTSDNIFNYNGKYIVGIDDTINGIPYIVKVNIYRDTQTNEFPFQYMRVGLFVDGIDVNYWKRVDLSAGEIDSTQSCIHVKFHGFQTRSQVLNEFIFNKPRAIDTSINTNIQTELKPLGSIHVVFYEAIVQEGIFNNDNIVNLPNIPHQSNNVISDQEKFWKQSSLNTIAGNIVNKDKEPFRPVIKWKNKSPTPFYEMTLFYHSISMIEFFCNFINDERANLSANITSSKRSNQDIIVLDEDLITKSEGENDIEIIDIPKIVPLLDLTESQPTLKYIKKQRNLF